MGERDLRHRLGQAAVLVTAACVLTTPVLTAQALRVRTADAWQAWWSAEAAPAQWSEADARLTSALRWRVATAPGLRWGDATLNGDGEAWRVRVLVVEIDPRQIALRLDVPPTGRRWRIEDAPDDVLLAVNAGQFTPDGPWGWLAREGRELQSPGRGPLAMAFLVDRDGRPHFVTNDALDEWRHSGRVAFGFQSYPVLLEADGRVPLALRDPGSLVRLAYRDARLAIGRRRDGTLLLAMTRFEGLGGVLELVPFGLTTPEMAAVMGALGCETALALDGGISSQLRLREADGQVAMWPGLRRVPLGLVASPRPQGRAASVRAAR
jgi:hypothetical protein